MYLAASLITWMVVLVAIAPRLASATWPAAAPRLGLLAWQVLVVSSVMSVLAAAGLLWHNVIEPALAWVLAVPSSQVDEAYRLSHAPWTWVIAALIALIVLHVLVTTARELWIQTRLRHRHREALDLLMTGRDQPFLVVEHDRPAVYCVPGHRARVVATSAALRVLDGPELVAALRHEEAHLRARHHWLLITSRGVRRALPRLRSGQLFARAVDLLTEMAADDVAAGRCGRDVTARALFKLASNGDTPPATLAATGANLADVERRLQRLVSPRPLGLQHRALIVWVLVGAALVPLVAVILPGLHISGR